MEKFSIPLTRRNLYKRDKGHCRICGKGVKLENCIAAHIVLRSNDGKTTYENMVIAHPKCISHRDLTAPLDVLPIHVPIEERGW